jgi:hypothetical protein
MVMDMMMNDEYLTEREASKLSKHALPTLRNHRHLGRGFPYIKVGRKVLYRKSDILATLEAHRIVPER